MNDYRGEWHLPVDDGDHRLYVPERGTSSPMPAVHGGPGDAAWIDQSERFAGAVEKALIALSRTPSER